MDLAVRQALVRVGKIDFLNALPFFYAWDRQDSASDLHFVKGSPQEINQKMARGELDVGLTSSLAYARDPERFMILPGLCIGSYRHSGSVALYSRVSLVSLNSKKIALSSKSLSASSLLKILLRLRYGFSNEFEDTALPPEQALERYEACLAIGDEALFFRPPGCQIYDLSAMWWDWTGTPFCFALWTVRRSFFEKNPLPVQRVLGSLERNLARNLERLESVAAEGGGPYRQKEVVVGYLRSLEYRLNHEILDGLRLFFQYAGEIGLVGRDIPLNFCSFLQGDSLGKRRSAGRSSSPEPSAREGMSGQTPALKE